MSDFNATVAVFTRVLLALLLVLLSLGETDVKPPESLRLVHYLFRHGDRSPTHGYTGDPNPPSTWPRGSGQLSRTGMQQLYSLGLRMRQRYDGFLNRVYQPDEIDIVSTDVDRTIQSAQSHLAGLYKPTIPDIWNQEIDWQPIAIHSLSKDVDFVMAMKNCPKLAQLRKEIWNIPYYKEITSREQPFIDWISWKVNKQYTIQNMYQLKDPIYIEYNNNLTLPSFINTSTVERLVFFDLIAFKSQSHTEQLQRLSGGGGPLIGDVLKRVRRKIRGELPDLKLYVYSGHDSTITAFLQTIENFNDICPPFATVVIIELHEVDGKFHLEVLYKNNTHNPPFALSVRGCDSKCPLKSFENLVRPVIAHDLMTECALETVGYDTSHNGNITHLMIVFACLAAILTAIVVFQMVMILTMRKTEQRQNYETMGSSL